MIYIVPPNTTIKVAKKGSHEYILCPPGDTSHVEPVDPTYDSIWTEHYTEGYNLEVNVNQKLEDSSTPKKPFYRYVGGRPNDR